jgi:hypothetical protein
MLAVSMNKRAIEQQKIYKSKWRRAMRFLFPPKKPTENIFQYIVRQCFLCDSTGRPSITVTILIYTMLLFGAVVGVACTNALVMKTITDAAKIVSVEPTGFSDTFLVMMMGLTVILTGVYRQRQKKTGADEPGEKEGGITSTIKQFIANKIGNLSWGSSNNSGMPTSFPSPNDNAVGDPKDVVGQ